MYIEDTIGAIATAPGMGGIGVIRVSGPDAFGAVNRCFRGLTDKPLIERQNRSIQYGHIVDGDGEVIDEVLLLLMKGPHSFTAEDVVEVHCHGGSLPLRSILQRLLAEGVRLAEPGEFSKRAFLNGRIDLTQAEAIIDIIEAKSDQALRLANRQLSGTLASKIRAFREDLIAMIAQLEVTIDYPEEDIEELSMEEVDHKLVPLEAALGELLRTAQSGRLIREGLALAIVGRPNAGKSSLLNALLQENRAIVTDIPGTTRDSIEEFLTVDGLTLRLIDTAGIRETDDIVEKIGVDKAKTYLDEADIVVLVIDGSSALDEEEKSLLRLVDGRHSIVFINKQDKGVSVTAEDVLAYGTFTKVAGISAAKGEGLEVVAEVAKALIYGDEVAMSNDCLLTNVRHIGQVEQAIQFVAQARETMDMGMPVDCVVTDLRQAWDVLGEITGDSLRESMVDELFKRFCLGK